jgi:cytochrome c oxidase subunit II
MTATVAGRRSPARPRRPWLGLLLLVGAAGSTWAAEPLPRELEGVGVTEHLGAQLPLDAVFTDHAGRQVRLGDYFRDGKPVILTLNYYSCPMLCGLQLNGLLAGLKGLDWTPGREFRVVTVSIDPRETAALAAGKRTSFLNDYGRGAADWSFLVGAQPEITRLAAALGFGYRYDAPTKQYAHPAVLYAVSPTGRVSRYLYGIDYRPRDLKFALLEASAGKTGSSLDRLILSCFHYDGEAHRYGPYAFGIMRLAGGLSVLALGLLLAVLWWREHRRERPAAGVGVAAGTLPLLLPLALGPEGSALLPPAASTGADSHDALFYFVLAVTAFFFVLVVGLVAWFTVRYRQRRAGQRTSGISHNRRLEVAWAVIPSILLVVIFGWGFKGFLDMSVPPAGALEVRVTAQKWSWAFEYPRAGIRTSKELVVPVGRPVKLTMSSLDVIHGFYVPAFRLKRDVLPNRYTVTWFEAKQPGEYDLMCTQYCGTGHSAMLGRIVVKPEAEYQAWVDSGGGMSGKGLSSVEFGKLLFDKEGCVACHSLDGTAKSGPSLLGRYGSRELLEGGAEVLVDDNYLRESLMDPAAKVVKGYQPVMPTFRGRLNDRQIDALIDFIKSLKR